MALATFLVAFQTKLIYPADFPAGSREHVDNPAKYELPYEDVTLTTPDGVKVRGYYIRPMMEDDLDTAALDRRPTLLYLHANAGNMGHRLPIAEILYRTLRCNIFMLSYRGYGLSEGSPSEKGMRIDAQTALDYLKSHPACQDRKIIVYGQSIGGAVTIDLVARNQDRIAAMMVENTFLSLPELIPSVMPGLRHFTFLCHQRWPSAKSLATVRGDMPMLFLSSKRDELIPPAHMRGLYEAAVNAATAKKSDSDPTHRVWREFAAGTHNDAPMQPGYFDAIHTFWRDEIKWPPTGSLP
ncbi:Alpha/Beta hydrolase protein [Blastocladiella britannica]|nr:Alpha/Beta hydrolase protein [Blastocladiella britannica]